MTLDLDVDVVRALLGGWRAQPMDAGVAARRLALAMAATHLNEGHDVIVPQFLAREQFLDHLAATAEHSGARFVEVALMVTRDRAIEAFRRRSERPESQQHRDAAADVERAGGDAALGAMYDAYVDLVERRPHARRVDVVAGDIGGTVAVVESILDEIG